MYAISDTTGIDMQPERDHNTVWLYVCIAFVLFGSYLCVQLFTGVIVDSFNQSKEEQVGTSLLSEEQKEWIQTKKVMMAIKPTPVYYRPSHPILGFFFDLCQGQAFGTFITICIVTQCIALAVASFGQSDAVASNLDVVNIVLAFVFFFEAVFKLLGFGPKVYFGDTWNRLDFVVVLGSIAALISTVATGRSTGLVINIMRLLRLARLVRLTQSLKSLQRLVTTVILTLPGITNISFLLALVLYIFSVIGVNLFAKVGYYGSYEFHGNFRTFGVAFLTLIRFLCGEGWGQFMYDLSQAPPGCVNDPPFDNTMCGFNDSPGCQPLNGCGGYSVYPYLLFYNVVLVFVFLSVFISVILSSYTDSSEGAIKPEDFLRFSEAWKKYDPDADAYMPAEQLPQLVDELFKPLGFGGETHSFNQYHKRVRKIKLANGHKEVHFSDVLMVLSQAVFERKAKYNTAMVFDLKKETHHESLIPLSLGGRKQKPGELDRGISTNTMGQVKEQYTINDLIAVQNVQQMWKVFKSNRKQVVSVEEYERRRKLFESKRNRLVVTEITTQGQEFSAEKEEFLT